MEPARPTLPVKNQLIAKVSRVPKVRQLIALRTDRECVSPPRNKITLGLSNRSNSFNHITAVADLTAPRPDECQRAGMLTIRIAYSLDGQEVRPTPA